MSAPKERTIGILQLCAAAIMLLVAIFTSIGSFNRWRGISALQTYHTKLLAHDENQARDAAKAAASAQPYDAACALSAIDLSQSAAAEALERLPARVEAKDREVIDIAMGFHKALQGKRPDGVEGSNGKLLLHLMELASGNLPTFPELTKGLAPRLAILRYVAARHVASAWVAGKPEELRRGLEALVLIAPDHAEAAEARAVLAAVGEHPGTAVVYTQNMSQGRSKLMRQLALLRPQHARSFIRAIPDADRTSDEAQSMLLDSENADLKGLVDRALQTPNDALLVGIFRRCLQVDDATQAARLIEKASDAVKPAMQLALAWQLGDAAAVLKLQPDRRDIAPRCSTPIGREGLISFHLGSEGGLVPRNSIDVRINGERIAPDRIKRWGSLVLVEFRGGNTVVTLEVRIGDSPVYSGEVKL